MTHSELPPDGRRYKGRVVFEGSLVSDQTSNVAVFEEVAPSASLMSASKIIDVIGRQQGWGIQQSDAQQAFPQSELKCTDTWVFPPSDQWPKGWESKYRSQVVKLRLALYGHPLSGALWERHCTEALLSAGFEPVPQWESTFIHKNLQMILSVYVDDFKMAGLTSNMKKAWSIIRNVISMDEPRDLGKYLGRGHEHVVSVSNAVIKP